MVMLSDTSSRNQSPIPESTDSLLHALKCRKGGVVLVVDVVVVVVVVGVVVDVVVVDVVVVCWCC